MDKIECAAAGRIVNDPTMRETKAGKPWASVTLHIGDGDAAQFLQCAIFGEHAGEVANLKAGALLYVEGQLSLNSYTTAAGEQRHGLKATCFVARPLAMIGQKRPPRTVADAPQSTL